MYRAEYVMEPFRIKMRSPSQNHPGIPAANEGTTICSPEDASTSHRLQQRQAVCDAADIPMAVLRYTCPGGGHFISISLHQERLQVLFPACWDPAIATPITLYTTNGQWFTGARAINLVCIN